MTGTDFDGENDIQTDFIGIPQEYGSNSDGNSAVIPQEYGSNSAVIPTVFPQESRSISAAHKDIYINKLNQEVNINFDVLNISAGACVRESPQFHYFLNEYRINKTFFINPELISQYYGSLGIYDKFINSFLGQLASGRPLTVKGVTYSHEQLREYARSGTESDFYIIFDNFYRPRKSRDSPIVAKPVTDYTKFIFAALVNRVNDRTPKAYQCADGFILTS